MSHDNGETEKVNNEDLEEKSLEENEDGEGSDGPPREYLLKKLQGLKVDTKNVDLKKPPEAFRMGGELVATKGNFSLIVGKAKSKKSFFVAILARIALKGVQTGGLTVSKPLKDTDVLYLDTEQGQYHAGLQALRIEDHEENFLMGPRLHYYQLRRVNTEERFHSLELLLSQHPNTGLVILDGVRDIASAGVNDEQTATEVCDMLMRLSEEYNVHIVTILHTNKADSNPRGHLGSELLDKAESSLAVVRQDSRISTVEPICTRSIEPPVIVFGVEEDGRPNILENPEEYLGKDTSSGRMRRPEELSEDEHLDIINDLRERKGQGEQSSNDLQRGLAEVIGDHLNGGRSLGEKNTREWWKYYKDANVLEQMGKGRWRIGDPEHIYRSIQK